MFGTKAGWIHMWIKCFNLCFAAKLNFESNFGGFRGRIRRKAMYASYRKLKYFSNETKIKPFEVLNQ